MNAGRPVILDGVTFHLELNSDDGSIDDVSIGVVSVKDFISDDTLKRLLAKLRAMRRDEREEAHYAECGR